MNLVERVELVIAQNQLLQPGGRLVVAVSAGPDSVCLLRVLHQLSSRFDWSLLVAHLNHGFRGQAARTDAVFVQQLAEQLGCSFMQQTVDIPRLLAERGGSSQDVSRQERYRFLRQVAADEQAQAILLAHHQGDQAETVLQHLLRGAGSGGLAGMRPREEGDPCPLVRPLLAESRQQIMCYLQSIGQGFRVDQSNAESHYQRNRLRWETMPLLAELNGDIEAGLSRTAALLQAEDQLLNTLAGQAYRDARLEEAYVLALDATKLRQLPLALSRRVLRLAWAELSPGGQDLEFGHVQAALALLGQPVGASCSWPRGFICRQSYRQLLLMAPDQLTDGFHLPLSFPGVTVLPRGLGEIRASIFPRLAQPLDFSDPNRVYCDYRALCQGQLAVRSWLPGDQFWPFGFQGKKKLQDFFTDAKIPRHQRRQIPLVISGEQLAWVVGLRLAEPFRVTACSREILCLEYRHSED